MISIREDGRIEWQCKHGIGHTIAIPYHLVQLIITKASTGDAAEEIAAHFSHGCDGCCDSQHKDGPKAQKIGNY